MTRPISLLLVGLLSIILVVSPLASAEDSSDHVFLAKSPQVSINLSSTLNVNVSYTSLFISTPDGVLGANLGSENWTLANNSGAYAYDSSFVLTPVADSDLADQYRNIMNIGDEVNLGGQNLTSLPVNAVIGIARYNGSISSLNLVSQSLSPNTTLTDINTSTLKLSFALSFNVSSQMARNGSITIVLVQSAGGSEDSTALNYDQVDAFEGSSNVGNGLAMSNGSKGNVTNAVYWWSNNFTYNGINGKDNVSIVSSDSGLLIAFVFNTPVKQGAFGLSQDPYISVKGANFIGSKVLIYSQPVVNFLFQHMEFFAGGIIAGGIVFLAMYGKYRKNRVRI